MAFANDKDGDRRRKSDQDPESETPNMPQSKKKRAAAPEVGNALRSIYQKTVGEDIPPEMLDLLGKLG